MVGETVDQGPKGNYLRAIGAKERACSYPGIRILQTPGESQGRECSFY